MMVSVAEQSDIQEQTFTLPTISGVVSGAEALALRALMKQTDAKPILHICHHDRQMQQLQEQLAFFLPDLPVWTLPAWDCLPYDRSSPAKQIMAERVATLARLSQPKDLPPYFVILTTASALVQRVPPCGEMAKASFVLKQGDTLDLDRFVHFLSHHGYSRVGKVMEPGEYAVRGSIVDLYPSGHESAWRVDLFGDEIESIREMEPLTQRSGEAITLLELFPASELSLNEHSVEYFRSRYRELFGAAHRDDALYAAISNSQHYPGMEHWMGLFYPEMDAVFDYLPQVKVTLDYQLEQTLQDRYEMMQDYYQARLEQMEVRKAGSGAIYNPAPIETLYLSREEIFGTLEKRNAMVFSPFAQGDAGNDAGFRQGAALYRDKSQANPIQKLVEAAEHHQRAGRHVVVCASTQGSLERINKMLSEQHVRTKQVKHFAEVTAEGKPGFFLAVVPIEQGFRSAELMCFTEQDIFGQKLIRTMKRRKPSEAFMQEAGAFEPGELLVHSEHGIGRFEGLETMEAGGVKRDCLKLIYKDEDKLFLPVENIEMVSRHGGEATSTELDKLGAGGWQARKARMKERLRMAAEELMKIAAARAMNKAPSLMAPEQDYQSFVARFPYQETDDQERAIYEVLADLEAEKPMDRLVCGDVGFGKTEVAIRAAFAAASDAHHPVQVALVAPTTLLVRQHYKNFIERFEGTGLKVAQLSRLCSAKEAKQVKEGLADGSVHIVIGTHALLAKSIAFENLGLLIIDEEQRFGVKQKEQLKEYKSNVHVLTLSATPIPRTLQMSLSGVRDLSLITTPPVDRLAVRSFVLPFDPVILREAIIREMHRGGQVFYVTPRVKDIPELKQRIMELVPETRLAVAHGQMAAVELDQIMNDFYDGKYDVLLSTTIIESGLDVPTANTMIINRADRFGLAQLYQLRGRVGRSKTRAYAYFTLPHQAKLTKDAIKRLEVMQSLDTLGAGFSLASHDMDIRGFGNLVGEEQSGHVKEVGVELYQQMLTEAVEALKSEVEIPMDEDWSPQILLGISAIIPESYIEDLSLRMSLYRRLSILKEDEEIESFAAEMVDRFGSLPQEVEYLIAVIRLKHLCKHAGIERIDTGPKGAVLTFREQALQNPEALIGYIAKHSATMKIRPDQKLVCQQNYTSPADRLQKVRQLVEQIARLVSE